VHSSFVSVSVKLPGKPEVGQKGEEFVERIQGAIAKYQTAVTECTDTLDGAQNMLPGKKLKTPNEPALPDFSKFSIAPEPKAKAKGKARAKVPGQ